MANEIEYWSRLIKLLQSTYIHVGTSCNPYPLFKAHIQMNIIQNDCLPIILFYYTDRCIYEQECWEDLTLNLKIFFLFFSFFLIHFILITHFYHLQQKTVLFIFSIDKENIKTLSKIEIPEIYFFFLASEFILLSWLLIERRYGIFFF